MSRLGGLGLRHLWLVAVAVALTTYLLRNPPLHNALLNLTPLALAAGFVAALCGLGWPVVRLLAARLAVADQLLCAVGVGVGLTGGYVLALGLGGRLTPLPLLAWTVLGLGLFVAFVLRLRPWTTLRWPRSSPLAALAAVIATPFLLQAIPPLATPPVSRDALEYHLLVPRLLLEQGRISYLPSLLESNYPSLAEYLYTVVLPLSGDIACSCLHFLLGLLAVWALGRLVVLAAPEQDPTLAPALLLALPAWIVVIGWAGNDGLFVLLLLLAVGQLLDYQARPPDQRDWGQLVLAGTLAGFAGWTKYTMVLYLPALAVVVAAVTLSRPRRWRHALGFFGALGGVSLTWLVKNWVMTGNPVYPFLPGLFPSPFWTQEAARFFHNYLTRLEMSDWDWWTYLGFPLRMTLWPKLVDAHTGITPLVLAPLLLVRTTERRLTLLKLFVATTFAAWLAIQTETRSLLAALAVLLAVGGAGLEQQLWRHPRLRPAVAVLLLLASASGLVVVLVVNYHLTRPVDYFIGREERAAFVKREASSQPVYAWLNHEPAAGVVLLVGLHDPYYLDRPALFSSCCDPPVAEVVTRGATTATELARSLRARGVTHIAVDSAKYSRDLDDGLYSWTPAERIVFEELLAAGCPRQAVFGSTTVCRLR